MKWCRVEVGGQPSFGFVEGDFPAAEAAGRSMLSLPMSPNLSGGEIESVCAAVTEQVSAHAAW